MLGWLTFDPSGHLGVFRKLWSRKKTCETHTLNMLCVCLNSIISDLNTDLNTHLHTQNEQSNTLTPNAYQMLTIV